MKNIVELMLERESQEIVITYCEKNERLIQNPKSKGSLHSTVYFSMNYPLFPDLDLMHNLKDRLPIVLNPKTYFFDIFGNCLVLRYDNKKVREINEFLKNDLERQKRDVWPNLNKSGIKTLNQFPQTREIAKYSQFNPHVTFSKKFNEEKFEKLPTFDEALVLGFTNFAFKY